MSQLAALRACRTLHNLATLLGFKPASISYILYVQKNEKKYRAFDIPKRGGGHRQIAAPTNSLKLLQKRLSDLLQDCQSEIYHKKGLGDDSEHPDRTAHGFRRRRSIISNAREHRHRTYVFNVDIEDFFPSINFGRVRGFFIKNSEFSLDPKIATILAQIACHNNQLPQGSPCSPIISNLIAHILDMHLVALAQDCGCNYSRYADDLTFSTNKRGFPLKIATLIESESSCCHEWVVGSELKRIVQKNGFALNSQKTSMQYADSRQTVTGLIVNDKINVRKEYRHTVRSMVHRLFTTGEFHIEKTVRNKQGETELTTDKGTLQQLHGMLGFIDSIDRYNGSISSSGKATLTSSKERMYKYFLLYKEFYVAERPVLICEGKTDTVYITHAIRSLAKQYPKLATIGQDGGIQIGIRRFRYSEASTGRILGLGGGTADLSRFIETYRQALQRFSAPGLYQPVVILVDNDSAGGKVLNTARKLSQAKQDNGGAYVHVAGNLYVMPVPQKEGAESTVMEDLFTQKTKSIELKGKKLDLSKKVDKSVSYDKADFAYQVVKPNADNIDFGMFAPLLACLTTIIEHHGSPPQE